MKTFLQKVRSISLFSALSLVLTGCVSLQAPSLSAKQTAFKRQSPQRVAHKLKALTTWQAQGALSIQSQQQVGMGNFSMDVSPQAWLVHMSSNLNLASLTMGSGAHGIWYIGVDGKRAYADSVQSLMLSQFGFAVPFKTMLFWLKGLPAPGLAVPSYNRFGQLQSLRQMDWVLHYDHYALYAGVPLPGVITVQGHGEFLKIVIKKWTFSKLSLQHIRKVHKKN